MLHPDGAAWTGLSVSRRRDLGLRGVVIDGNDQVWSSNFNGEPITHLCGIAYRDLPTGDEDRRSDLPARTSGAGPLLPAVREYKESVAKYPNPPAANMTRF